MSPSDGLRQPDGGIAGIAGDDVAKYVRSHHAKRWTIKHLVTKRAALVGEYNLLRINAFQCKITAYAALQIHQNLRHCVLVKALLIERLLVFKCNSSTELFSGNCN
eukprot:CAMPEP_0118674862 /NCGR_PEP_ID=MMETSP0800-20121206/1121_1 /TAXON_ID=210618 ORGANISM="Striatella unipunctata, Strain CCMP2910" /NCGR_SAMPLE_ID=MMETSP0800 /ASSEMBLY_ACC=CAM_ASM_000638 /LENGTH=105 /DNA_ID=CAMNT_0006570099 /DNA_START=8 /DNA_END=325 /DNA_ORIENTATION=+